VPVIQQQAGEDLMGITAQFALPGTGGTDPGW
jgi:hypothetical protein